MLVKDLINTLSQYQQDAEIKIIDTQHFNFHPITEIGEVEFGQVILITLEK